MIGPPVVSRIHPRPRAQESRLRAAGRLAMMIAVVSAAAVSGGCGCSKHSEVTDSFNRRYMMPRAYPNAAIDPAHRTAALEHLAQMHAEGPPHLNPGQSPPSGASACVWTSAGPTNVNGRVTSIAIDSARGERLFVATVGGVWRSIDSGKRWQRVLTEARPGVFGAVAVHEVLTP